MTKRRFNQNQLVTYVKNEYDKTILIRYYKNMITMSFEPDIVYKYKFKNNNCIENKYIKGALVACRIFEGKSRDILIAEIQADHAYPTRQQKQITFFEALRSFFGSN